jgi:tRNA modification GTPase
VLAAASAAAQEIATLLATAPAGELVREGAVVVLAGPPNAGKSSLFNALLGERRAIVTDVPGTTRDALEAVVDAGGWPLRLVDTAGLRETADVVERLGVETSEAWLARAHVVLACGESDARLADAVARVRAATDAPVVPVRTKADLLSDGDQISPGALAVSAARGTGLAELLERAAAELRARYGAPAGEVPLLTRARHRRALAAAGEEAARFQAALLEEGLPATVAAVHLRAAAHALEELIGAVDVEDVLGRVFASFCVGK